MSDAIEDGDFIPPEERWEKGIPHDEKSRELVEAMQEISRMTDSYLTIEMGGDGDNGEEMMYLLDCYFEAKSEEANQCQE